MTDFRTKDRLLSLETRMTLFCVGVFVAAWLAGILTGFFLWHR
jgi:hypothetical protein